MDSELLLKFIGYFHNFVALLQDKLHRVLCSVTCLEKNMSSNVFLVYVTLGTSLQLGMQNKKKERKKSCQKGCQKKHTLDLNYPRNINNNNNKTQYT